MLYNKEVNKVDVLRHTRECFILIQVHVTRNMNIDGQYSYLNRFKVLTLDNAIQYKTIQ